MFGKIPINQIWLNSGGTATRYLAKFMGERAAFIIFFLSKDN